MKSDLPPGVYTLKVSVQSFKEYSDVLHLPGQQEPESESQAVVGICQHHP